MPSARLQLSARLLLGVGLLASLGACNGRSSFNLSEAAAPIVSPVRASGSGTAPAPQMAAATSTPTATTPPVTPTPTTPPAPTPAPAAGLLNGVVNASVAGSTVGSGSPSILSASVLSPTPAVAGPVSVTALPGQNAVQGLVSGLTSTVSNPGTLLSSVQATLPGTLPVGALPVLGSATTAAPLVNLNLAGTPLLGSASATPVLANAAIAAPTAARPVRR